MRMREGVVGALHGSLIGLGLSLFVVAGNAGWSLERAAIVSLSILLCSALIGLGAAALLRVAERLAWSWKVVALPFCGLAISTGVLVLFHHGKEIRWLGHAVPSPGGDGVLWQVHTTFLSVGFAGLAVAAQLFAEAPLAIGASRGRVLSHVHAGPFVAIGLVANLLIALETIWLPSSSGVVFVAVVWFAPTVALLVFSTIKLMQLFGNPSRLDEVVRTSLVGALADRLQRASRAYSEARRALEPLYSAGYLSTEISTPGPTFRVRVSQSGLVVRAIRPHAVRRAIGLLLPNVTAGAVTDHSSEESEVFTRPEVTLDVEPGDRTRLGDTAFRVSTSRAMNDQQKRNLAERLQSAIEYEPPGAVTPDEQTDREISNLKDAVSTSLRSGAFGTAERALELLGQVVRGVWTAHLESPDSSRRSSFTRRDWLFWSVGETEQDVTLSPRAAGMFISQAMTRALEAPRTGSTDYVDECLRSFTRIWSELLAQPPSKFDLQASRIVTCMQNLAAYTYSASDEPTDFHLRATWAIVDLVKLALDAKRVDFAESAARELRNLFRYVDRTGNGRAHVRAGQLVLSGWLLLLAAKGDVRDPGSAELRRLLTPGGSWSEILAARRWAERGLAPFSRWEWWEVDSSPSGEVQTLELSHYVDRAELTALARSRGTVPPASDQAMASEYDRFERLLAERGPDLQPNESLLRDRLAAAVRAWTEQENDRLAVEPLSDEKFAKLLESLRSTLSPESRLAEVVQTVDEVPETADTSRPILGMNFRVPRHYLVEQVFNQTYADPEELGRIIGRGFIEGEDGRILELLRSASLMMEPTLEALRHSIERLDATAWHHVLVTPYGGLFELDGWYSSEFRQVLDRISHFEVADLENEAILFDSRILLSCRRPEEKEGLTAVNGTTLAIGVFEDVLSEDAKEPQVRIETGEFFVVWQAAAGDVLRFASPREEGVDGETSGAD